jgi:ABC-type Fe3+ transport system substrate-binding protein
LTLYSSQVSVGAWTSKIAPVFYAQYPWAAGKVSLVNFTNNAAGATQMEAKVVSDFKAGKVQADVVWGPHQYLYPIFPVGAVQNYSSPVLQQMNYSRDEYDPNGAWAAVNVMMPVLEYNPKVLAANNLPVPGSWTDLANPAYKGQIEFVSPSTSSPAAGVFYYLYTQMGNSSGQWTQFMKNVVANSPRLTSASPDSDVAAGKAALGISHFTNFLAQSARTPDSISSKIPSPTVYGIVLVSVMKNSSHPQMARLMEDWLLSSSGQLAIAQIPLSPSQIGIGTSYNLIPSKATLVLNDFDNPALVNATAWSSTFRSIFGA